MSQQPQGTSCQPTAAPSHDWTQVPDEELEVLMDNSKGTKQAKEAKRKALQHEEEECQQLEEEHLVWEWAEQEQWVQEEHERQRAKEAAQQTMSGKGKGHMEELQREGQLMQMTRMGSMPIYSPTTGAQLGEMAVPIYQVACDKCQQRGEAHECWVAAGGQSCGLCRKQKKKCSWAAKD
ncbi:hypothetical protein PISMIDRAFT_13017 [Pisolithus microcarpus 441]|uniref:Uncharacterized protein n=1 Tax=Pisolithus microcarpus 441 TaxID=765257 RepID=A0A0C9Y6Z9_9AGAM|nr:hypothetical protein PISMIDRAFT_13017 [Pisolithus microcarpus 441]